MPSIFHNRLPRRLREEIRLAHSVGAVPVEVPSDEFDNLAIRGERLIYVVVEGRVLVSEATVRLQRVTHAVLAKGRPVEAAGEVELVTTGFMVVIELNNRSGHYLPDPASLDVARAAFEARGFDVPTSSIDSYTQGGP